jgi:hypothetical protein
MNRRIQDLALLPKWLFFSVQTYVGTLVLSSRVDVFPCCIFRCSTFRKTLGLRSWYIQASFHYAEFTPFISPFLLIVEGTVSQAYTDMHSI